MQLLQLYPPPRPPPFALRSAISILVLAWKQGQLQDSSLDIANNTTEIRTVYRLNTSQVQYCYIRPLSITFLFHKVAKTELFSLHFNVSEIQQNSTNVFIYDHDKEKHFET